MTSTAVTPYRALAYNNGWANHRLLTACLSLSDAAFAAPRTNFFPSLKQTLNHILIVDHFYVDALEGGALGYGAFEDEAPCATVADLLGAQAAVDARLIAVCDRLTAEALETDVHVHRGARVQVERCDRLLLHLFQHQIHHRGQAHAMLSGILKPPQLDEFFSAGEAPLRAEEFASLGWTEDRIWED